MIATRVMCGFCHSLCRNDGQPCTRCGHYPGIPRACCRCVECVKPLAAHVAQAEAELGRPIANVVIYDEESLPAVLREEIDRLFLHKIERKNANGQRPESQNQ